MIQITTMYHSINNQLTNGIRWNLINVLAINSHNSSTQMNISQNKLKCFVYLLPKRTGIFSTVNKYCLNLEYYLHLFSWNHTILPSVKNQQIH